MPTFPNRSQAALLVVDMQNAVVATACDRDAVVHRIATLVARARRDGVTVVWVRHGDADLVVGSEGWQIVAELVPGDGEPIVDKQYGDAFEDTALESVLAGSKVGHLVVTGAQTDACIRSTIHGAFTRGYDVTLVSDAHTTEDHTRWGAPPPDQVIAHTNLYWADQDAPGRRAGTAKTAEVHWSVQPG